jgi:MFS family permease
VSSPSSSPYAALKIPNYRLFLIGNTFSFLGIQMTSTAVGWDLYEKTGSAMSLAGIGLIQSVTILLCFLPSGHLSDRWNRKGIMMVTQLVRFGSLLILIWLSMTQASIAGIYACLFINALARSFSMPARGSFLPLLVPLEMFPNAFTWNSTLFQIACFSGPALAGLIIAVTKSAYPVYILDALLSLIFVFCLKKIKVVQKKGNQEAITLESFFAGLKFVWNAKVLLACLSLDLFAVLFGGATALLPIFAKDILQVGPSGLGWLRSAPFFGAFMTGFVLIHHPITKKVGKILLWAVASFGVFTMFFGVSLSFGISFAMLALIGASDVFSVVIRNTLVQTRTPDHLRGRVTSVNSLFIGLSNELGGFESGLVAYWFDPVTSVFTGGIGAILVVLAVAWKWPQLRNLDSIRPEEKANST